MGRRTTSRSTRSQPREHDVSRRATDPLPPSDPTLRTPPVLPGTKPNTDSARERRAAKAANAAMSKQPKAGQQRRVPKSR